MIVNLRMQGDGLHVRVKNEGGGSMTNAKTVILQKGSVWRGWKYARLARLGDGDHELLSRAETKQLKEAQKAS